MKKTLLFSFTQLVCTILYSSSELENNTDVKQEQIEQVQITTCEEICDPNLVLVEAVLVSECGSCCSASFFVETALLYWHPKVFGTEFACGSVSVNTKKINLIKDCFTSINPNWDLCFKRRIGYNITL